MFHGKAGEYCFALRSFLNVACSVRANINLLSMSWASVDLLPRENFATYRIIALIN